eukprot:CAMPEP_0205803256 /NCGR_PEP_ID=MMETSP0205-20121125/5856_1 /ASSEMBLY_ACC=CAM_ASM_000278 /TAXON_ID=36767 /ORGANISM="Euplotes focardii, Strain TN1" /LENGTH=55 /DNA_ID=CAMNT_0053071045 /DNA_START=260 /DNA_END=424 /DNA_ORIENTATION=+
MKAEAKLKPTEEVTKAKNIFITNTEEEDTAQKEENQIGDKTEEKNNVNENIKDEK